MFKQAKYILSLSVVLLLFAGVSISHAQADPPLEIGYINPQAVLQKMPKYQAVRQRMQNYAAEKRHEIQQQAQAFHQELASFQQRRSVMTKEAKKVRRKNLRSFVPICNKHGCKLSGKFSKNGRS